MHCSPRFLLKDRRRFLGGGLAPCELALTLCYEETRRVCARHVSGAVAGVFEKFLLPLSFALEPVCVCVLACACVSGVCVPPCTDTSHVDGSGKSVASMRSNASVASSIHSDDEAGPGEPGPAEPLHSMHSTASVGSAEGAGSDNYDSDATYDRCAGILVRRSVPLG